MPTPRGHFIIIKFFPGEQLRKAKERGTEQLPRSPPPFAAAHAMYLTYFILIRTYSAQAGPCMNIHANYDDYDDDDDNHDIVILTVE